ncbi:hypothetical protein ISCGN_007498 [Ixodes scapularis]
MPNPRLYKIGPILDQLVEKFQQPYTAQRDICIDESLLLWKGRLGWKQYIPMKRARFGMESFTLCEPASKYVWNVIVYTGKTTKYECKIPGVEASKLDKPSQVVVALSQDLLCKSYFLH